MARYLLLVSLFLLLNLGNLLANTLNIGLFADARPAQVEVTNHWGGYTVIGDDAEVLTLQDGTVLSASIHEGSVKLSVPGKELGTFRRVTIKRLKWGASFRIKTHSPGRATRIYKDNLVIAPWGSRLNCINNVFIEHYLPGVVLAESGVEAELEYYKVQSVIARTYALNNRRRHAGEGFHLCDQVHCQVHKGHTYMELINQAVKATRSMVLVDSEINLITASFFSNCGGQTMNSEDVWSKEVEYLRSRTDSFCLEMPHSHWDKEIAKEDWLHYLARHSNFVPNDTNAIYAALNYHPDCRETHFPTDSTLLLKKIRKDFDLRSTHFHIEEKDSTTIKVECRGFGHGVGLCQEGAMCMAEYGYKFNEILHYYYSDVHLIDLSVIDFFRE